MFTATDETKSYVGKVGRLEWWLGLWTVNSQTCPF